jgi:hypothetical protein
MRVQVFDLQAVLRNYNVRNVVDIDQARADNQPPAAVQVGAHEPGAATR